MLEFPLWKKTLILLLCLLGIVFASPNAFYEKVELANDTRAEVAAGAALTPERQEAIDAWPSWAPPLLVNLGLDLRGGAHVLVEVQLEDVYAERIEALWPEVRNLLREDERRDVIGTVRRDLKNPTELRVRIENADGVSAAMSAMQSLTQPVVTLTGAGSRDYNITRDGDEIIMVMSEAEKLATDDRTMEQTLEIIRRRVDETGTREPTIQRQGNDRVVVQVPGIGSAEDLLLILGKTAKLKFQHVEGRAASENTNPGIGNQVLPSVDEEGVFYILVKNAVITGDHLVDAQPTFDQNSRPAVSFRLNPAGARIFDGYSGDNIGNPFAIVLDDEVISAPTIQSRISGGSGIITGNFNIEESTRLSILLRAGALPAELKVLERRTIGPELGQDAIDAGRIACVVAFAAVLLFMFASYGLFGLFANVALILNVTLIIALLSIMGATLTLPGIAGIVLTIGMAVDANVLIFERIREEMKSAKSPGRAIQLGYEKALSAIVDANITTMIAAVILFAIGAGPVRGFSVTLGLGIITSVFTAIYVTRLFVSIWMKARNPETVEV